MPIWFEAYWGWLGELPSYSLVLNIYYIASHHSEQSSQPVSTGLHSGIWQQRKVGSEV